MKNFFKVLSVFIIFLSVSNNTFADCYTGFACSIKDLNKQNTDNQEFINNINNYFNKQVNENLFFGKLDTNINYNDLFIFNTIV